MSAKQVGRGCLGYFGVAFAIVCGATATVGIVKIASGEEDNISGAVGGMIFLSAFCIFGIWLAWSMLRRKTPEISEAEKEQRILRFAASKKGAITVQEVAMECQLSLTASKAFLDRLHRSGECELELTPNGTLLYVFKGFIADSERALAANPFEDNLAKEINRAYQASSHAPIEQLRSIVEIAAADGIINATEFDLLQRKAIEYQLANDAATAAMLVRGAIQQFAPTAVLEEDAEEVERATAMEHQGFKSRSK